MLHHTRGQDVTIESLDNGPGLLPFKLGPAKVVSHYHSFLNYIDLDNIQTQIKLVKAQISNLTLLLNNKTSALFEPHIQHLNTKLEKIFNMLLTFEPRRVKRGLINGLGSIIKGISGNLDYTDAIKYDKAIQALQNNEKRLETELNNHVSLNKEWISHSSKIIESIIVNQDKMNRVLNNILERTNEKLIDSVKYAHLAQHLLILGDNIEDLSDELYRLEYTLAFISASGNPHSVVSLVELRNMLIRVKNLYLKDEVLDIDYRDYYEIIKLGYFYVGNQIIIVVKVPIAFPTTYEFYKLCPVPNKNYEVLIPTLPFIAISGKDSRYMEAECPKANTWFLCNSNSNYGLPRTPDCIQQLIFHQELNQSCKRTAVILKTEALQELDDKHHILNFPTPTKVKISCGQDEYRILKGSYLVVIPLNCQLVTPGFTILNSHDRIRGHVVKMLEMPQDDESRQIENPSPVILNSASLETLHSINSKISLQSPLHLESASDQVLYHTTIPMYIILTIAGVIATVLVFRRVQGKRLQIVKPIPVIQVPESTTHKRHISPCDIKVDPTNISAAFSKENLE